MIDLGQANIQAAILFGIMLIVAILVYAVFFKEGTEKQFHSSSRRSS